jgi:hypothetical protein
VKHDLGQSITGCPRFVVPRGFMNPKPLALIAARSNLHDGLLALLRRTSLPFLHRRYESDPVRARSALLSDGLQTDADRFIFIDPDIVPTADDVVRLVESPKLGERSAVSGCYLAQPRHLAVQSQLEKVALFGEPRYAPLLVGGMGFAAVHRLSVDLVRAELPRLEDMTSDDWYPFFLPVVVAQDGPEGPFHQYLPDDYAFWWRLRSTGTEAWIDTHVVVGRATEAVWHPSSDREGENYTCNCERKPTTHNESNEAIQ